MYRYLLMTPAVVLLAGCPDPLVTDDKSATTDTDVTTSDETSDSEDPTDTETDPGDGDTTDDDTTDDTPSDTEDTTDTEVPESECHPWDPVDNNSFTRDYRVTFQGESGSEEQAGKGADLTSNSEFAYRVSTKLTTTSNSWDGSVYFSCDDYTLEGGVHVVEWSVDLTYSGLPLKQVVGVHSDPRMNLPPEDQMGSIGSWSYRYDLEVSPLGLPMTIPVVGTTTEEGMESITTTAGTWTAYKLTSSYVMDFTEAATYYPDIQNIEANATYYYAEGIGLVYELTVDASTGETIMEKELVAYTGL